MWLNAQTKHHAALEISWATRKELIRRPTNLTVEPISQAYVGPDLTEIIKFFRIDIRKTICLESFDKKLRGMRRRTASIVPAGKCDNQHGVVQFWNSFNSQRVHGPPSLSLGLRQGQASQECTRFPDDCQEIERTS